MKELPRLRRLEAFPIEDAGKKRIAIRDPLGVVSGVAIVELELYLVAAHFDGQSSFESIQTALRERYGASITLDLLREIAKSLDEKLLLEGPTFDRAWADLQKRFAASKRRPAFHAGAVYPADPKEAAHHLDKILASEETRVSKSLPSCILSPHIDYARGAATYSKVWASLRGLANPPVFLVLATSHAPMRSLLGLTKKDYETPFGLAKTNRGFVEALASRLTEDPFVDEIAHRTEHAAELQIHILRHLFPEASIVPVLCGHLGSHGENRETPGGAPLVEATVQALRETLAQYPGTVLVLGVDLAHVGPRFGSPELFGESALRRVEEEDRKSLDRAAALDAEGFYRAVMQGEDPRKVCGLSPIYLGVRCLSGVKGKLLDYRQCTSEDQSVTIAGMIWSR